MTYSMTCACGDVMTVDAADRNQAVQKLKEMMTEDAINAHMSEKHPGDPVLPMSQVHMMIEQGVQEA